MIEESTRFLLMTQTIVLLQEKELQKIREKEDEERAIREAEQEKRKRERPQREERVSPPLFLYN